MRNSKNLIVICGPTASGKTRLGVRIARAVDGEIISADSRQVYRGLDIGTGKDLDEYRRSGPQEPSVPYHLIDIADPARIYTVAQYQADFYRAFEEVRNRGNFPVAVGGTGLYIEAVLRYYRIPAVAEKPAFRKARMAMPKETLLAELRHKAPDLHEKTDHSSKKRIIRSLEIAYFRSHQQENAAWASPPQLLPLILCVQWPREELRQRIDRRLMQRFDEGMIDEVRRLKAQGVSPERLALLGMEYKHINRYLEEDVDFDAMVALLRRDIHRLAKRQDTWFRGMERRGLRVHWIARANFDEALAMVRSVQWQ